MTKILITFLDLTFLKNKLQRVKSLLERVEQSPTKSLQDALSPSLKALIGDALLRHADIEVKVTVASCVIDIVRISAPEIPYDDDQMKVCTIILYYKFIDFYRYVYKVYMLTLWMSFLCRRSFD